MNGKTQNFDGLEHSVISLLNQATGARGTDKEIECLLVAADLLVDAHLQVETLADELEKMAEVQESTIQKCPSVSTCGGQSRRLPNPKTYPLPDVDFVRKFTEGHRHYGQTFDRLHVLLNDFSTERQNALKAERKGRTGVSLAGLSLLGLTVPDSKFGGRDIVENDFGAVISSVLVSRPGERRYWGSTRTNYPNRVRLAGAIRSLRSMNVKGVRAGKALAERTLNEAAYQQRDGGQEREFDSLAGGTKRFGTHYRFKRLAAFIVPRLLPVERFYTLFWSHRPEGERPTLETLVKGFGDWNWTAFRKFARRIQGIPEGFVRPGAVLRNWGNAHCPDAFPENGECPIGEPETIGWFVPPGTEITIERAGQTITPVRIVNSHVYGVSLPPECFERKGENGETLPAMPWVCEVQGLPESVPVVRFETIQTGEHSQNEPWLFVFGRTSRTMAGILGQDRTHQRQRELQCEGFRRMLRSVRDALAEKQTAEKLRKERGRILLYLYRKNRTVRVLDSRQVGNCLGGTLQWCNSLGLYYPEGTNPEHWELPVRSLIRAVLAKGAGAFTPNAVRVFEKLWKDGQEMDRLEREERERRELERAELEPATNGTEGGVL